MTSVSQATNVMRRAISEIVDPGLTRAEKSELWKHFDSRCAFCDASMMPTSRQGHVDHLEAGGGNGPRNRVLACWACNGDEKLDRAWRPFLREKCASDEIHAKRLKAIESWLDRHPVRHPPSSPEIERAVRDADHVAREFHDACSRLRAAVKAASNVGGGIAT